MSKQKRYLRGQVWHWNDPVYGCKAEGNKVAEFDGTIRYSRYVLIIQNDENIEEAVVVIPLSSMPKDGSIVFYIYDNKPSYARVQNITTVSTKQLDNYICTLCSEDLKKIEDQILYILGFTNKAATPATTNEDVAPATSERHRWNLDSMRVFVEDFESHGPQYAALMYTLTEKSARKYYSSFKLKLEEAGEKVG